MDDLYLTLGAMVIAICLAVSALVVLYATPSVECERRVPESEGKGGAWDFGLESKPETQSRQRGTQ